MDFLVRARGLVSREILSQAKQPLCNGSLLDPTFFSHFVTTTPACDSKSRVNQTIMLFPDSVKPYALVDRHRPLKEACSSGHCYIEAAHFAIKV